MSAWPAGHLRSRTSASSTVGRSIRLLGLGALLVAASAPLAQSGGGYDLRWSAQGAGGGTMSGPNGYTLAGTLARPDASASTQTGASAYALRGGFWAGIHETGDNVFRNGFEPAP